MPTAFSKLLCRCREATGRSQKELALSIHEVDVKGVKPETVEQKLSKLLSGNDPDAVKFFDDPARRAALCSGLGIDEETYEGFGNAPVLFVVDDMEPGPLAFIKKQADRCDSRFWLEILPRHRSQQLDAMRSWGGSRLYVARGPAPDAGLGGALEALGVEFRKVVEDGDPEFPRGWRLLSGPDLFAKPEPEPAPTVDADLWPLFVRPDMERMLLERGSTSSALGTQEAQRNARSMKARFGQVPLPAEAIFERIAWVCRRPDERITNAALRDLVVIGEAPPVVWRHEGTFFSLGVSVEALAAIPEMTVSRIDELVARICAEAKAQLGATNPFHAADIWPGLFERLRQEFGLVPLTTLPPLPGADPTTVFTWPERVPASPDFAVTGVRDAVREVLARRSAFSNAWYFCLRECLTAPAVGLAVKPTGHDVSCAAFHLGGGDILEVAAWRFSATPPTDGFERSWRILDFGNLAIAVKHEHDRRLEGLVPWTARRRRAAEAEAEDAWEDDD